MKTPADRAAEVRRILDILHTWGIHTLGQLAALNKEELTLRLGPLALQLWERAQGKRTRLLKLVVPPESFEENFEFEHDVEVIESLLFILRRFLEQLTLRLNALYLVVQELELRIVFNQQNSYVHRFRIPQPTANVEVLFRVLHTHLEQFKSEHPITAVSLVVQPAKPNRQQFGLFESALRDPQQLSETLARLSGLLGADRVGTPVLEETHRPDSFQMEPFIWECEEARPLDEPLPSCALRRFRQTAPAAVLLEENQPAHLSSGRIGGNVSDRSGPYALSGQWWDKNSWQRVEWDLELENGTVCRCHQEGEMWALDGVYD